MIQNGIIKPVELIADDLEVGAAHPLPVVVTGGGGGGTQYLDGDTPATPTGTVALGQSATKVLHPLQTDASGVLKVSVSGAGSGGTSSVDQDAFTAGASAGTAILGAFDDVASSVLTENQVGIIRATANRAAHTNLRNAAGTEVGTSTTPLQVSLANTAANATAVKVDGSAVTQPISHANLDAAISTRLKPADTLTAVTTVGTITNVVHVDDNAGSLTVDGSVGVNNFPATQAISAASLPLPTGAATASLQTQPGVDIGDVTINNATGAAAVNVQDGGNSLTVDGTVALGAGSAVIGHVISDTGSTTAVTGNVTVVQGTGSNLHAVLDSGTLSTITNVVHVDDNAGNISIDDGGNSITVDGSVAVSNAFALEATQLSVKAAVETIDNFISGARGLVTEDNSAAILTRANLLLADTTFTGRINTQGQKTSALSTPVVLPSDALPPPDRATTGTILANSSLVSLLSGGTGTVSVTVTGTWVGTLVWFGIDGSGVAQVLTAMNLSTGALESTTTTNGTWLIPSAGWSSVGALSIAWTSGTANIGLIASPGSNQVALSRSLPTGTNSIGQVTANAGTNLNTSLLALEATQTLQATAAKQDIGNSSLTTMADAVLTDQTLAFALLKVVNLNTQSSNGFVPCEAHFLGQ